MKTQKFDEVWFAAQFGNRPKRSLFTISEEITATERKLAYLKQEYLEWEIYHAKEDAALKTFVNTIYNIKGKK